MSGITYHPQDNHVQVVLDSKANDAVRQMVGHWGSCEVAGNGIQDKRRVVTKEMLMPHVGEMQPGAESLLDYWDQNLGENKQNFRSLRILLKWLFQIHDRTEAELCSRRAAQFSQMGL